MLSYKFIYLIPSFLYIMDKKDNVKWFKDIKVYFAILCIAAYAILLFVLISSYKTIECEIDDKFTLFRDLLTLLLSIAGVAIAAVGIGIYQLILHGAERKLDIWEGEF